MALEKKQNQLGETLQWRGNAPVCERFDDVYYSAENGLEETRFVFLRGIDAPDIWADRDHFVVAETGFGTGLNFLATWHAWRDSGAKGRLTFISTEGYPLSEEALAAAHETFPDLAPLAVSLRKAWPPAAAGFHPRSFDDGQVRLLLLFGDAATSFARLQASVDAWFLDGFAPAKNPEMWSDDLMDQIARLSKPGTRFATFTAAGFVRRALQQRGFHVEKQPGYGRKRERLVGVADAPSATGQTVSVPEWATIAAPAEGTIGIIGDGIGGSALAAALAERGRQVTLIGAADTPTASDVPAAILAPRFVLDKTPAAEIFSSAYALSCCYPAYDHAWADAPGVDLLPKSAADADRHTRLLAHLGWTADWMTATEQGLRLPRGGSLSTATALSALQAKAPEHITATVTSILKTSDGWLLETSSGAHLTFDVVVIASGCFAAGLVGAANCPEIRPNRGQVELLQAPFPAALAPQSLAFGGYVTACVDGMRTLGSTFDPTGDLTAAATATDRARIVADTNMATGADLREEGIARSWAGVRATTPDHMPYAGAVPNGEAAARQYAALSKDAALTGLGAAPHADGLYMLSGLGSKGFQYGPLMAEFLAAQLCGDPLPLPLDTATAVHPLRDLIRRIKRKQL